MSFEITQLIDANRFEGTFKAFNKLDASHVHVDWNTLHQLITTAAQKRVEIRKRRIIAFVSLVLCSDSGGNRLHGDHLFLFRISVTVSML